MPFEGGEEEDAVARAVPAMRIDDGFDDGANEAFIVVALHAGLDSAMHSVDLAGVVVVIEHRLVEVALGGEVAEDDGFGDAGGGGDFLGGGAPVPFAGEEIEGGFEELPAAVAGGKPEVEVRVSDTASL